ncbi:M23 family metallopeptidase [Pacificibacter marinus]|nr:M23 family metallopeptidase [Pacificibacter marinus]
MRARTLSVTISMSLASPVLAGDISLGLPIDCVIGDSCYIQNYVDADPSDAMADFTCGNLSYDGHKGTDFALPTGLDLQDNVPVLASAAGTVTATRDGMKDHRQRTAGAPDVTDVECGNGLVIDHGAGWTTQYCHMMQGSIHVKKGDRLDKGALLGYVGLSGMTEFPHVHLAVRKDGKVVDPFRPDPTTTCGETDARTLWDSPLTYQSSGLLSVGITSKIPDYNDVKAGTAQAETLPTDSSALVVFGFAFGGQDSDIMRLELTGPNGTVASRDVTLNKPQAQYFNATGRKSSTGWPAGTYVGTVQIIRDGELFDAKTNQITVVP